MKLRIPKRFRANGRLRHLNPGVDLPCSFLDNIQSIDSNLYPIFHPYDVIYEDTMNQYSGTEEESRFTISVPNGLSEEIWGWPTKNRDDSLKEDGHWHLWSLSQVGWHHIVKIESTSSNYLYTLVNRLHFQSLYRERYGNLAWNKKMREDEKAKKEKEALNEADQLNEINKANKGLLRSAYEEFERGNFNPTNPTKEIITSYPNQKNHTKIVRPITDKEGGLITH